MLLLGRSYYILRDKCLVIAGFVFSDDFAPEKLDGGYGDFTNDKHIVDSEYNKLNESIGTKRSRSFGDSRHEVN